MRTVLVFRSKNQDLGCAWLEHFDGVAGVDVVEADITAVDCDAIVSPANSFGFMDGGLDWRLSEHFGWSMQDRVQETIRHCHGGELLVGQAEVVATDDVVVPWLICAPTMRVPMHIKHTVNVYLAMKAILRAATSHVQEPTIETVAVPGLGTGVGGLDPMIAARQMRAAWDEVIGGVERPFADFAEAVDFQLYLNPTGRIYD